MTLPPVTTTRARAVLALVSASRHGTESDRRRWLFRFAKDHGVPPHAVNWRQPVQKIPFSVVAAGVRPHVGSDPGRELAFLTCCLHAGQTGGVRYSYSESGYHTEGGTGA